jgi:hypothetical protein
MLRYHLANTTGKAHSRPEAALFLSQLPRADLRDLG